MNALAKIDATGAVPAIVPAITTRPKDWEYLNSPGHVLGARVKRLGWIGFPFALLAFVGGLYFTANSLAQRPGTFALPPAIVGALLGDPTTATDLGGGVKVDYRFHWMEAFNPTTRGLDPAQWTALVGAVRQDAAQFGLDATNWATVAELAVQPRITRPTKALGENADRMTTGIIAVPEGGRFVTIIAAVEGVWAIALTDTRGSCATILGPEIAGCSLAGAADAADQIMALRPAPATSKE